ncbi:hypothetical protein EUA93_09885 [Nocardioides oleivorans]|uniref:Uncharacterized protein n=1 Tax=Nocardioides oleivorans TaxID=273676 RepID=A0A4Q2S2M6_9ACTN|nr:hypothetical protein [Nocardioides oleivorans]RYB94624.1 hypothetical protein EUA93_09885 [Nocardioides oleivorans]
MTDVGQPDEVVVRALGVPVGIPATGDAARRLRHQWSRALTDEPPTTSIDVSEIASADDVAHDYAITTRVTMAALDATAGRRINLHAGAVADDEGRVLTVIGPSGSGKTTAIRLLASRLGYVSDETTSIDELLGVHAHAKPLSVITDPLVPLHKESLSPDELDLVRAPDQAWLHRIVLLHRGLDDDGLVPLDQAHAIAEIVEQTSSLVQLEHPILRLADTIDACGGVWSLKYVELEDWLDDLVGLLDLEGQPPPARLHHPGADAGEPAPGAWTRAAWRDAVEYDDELVLMVDDRVHVLAGLGVVVWLALADPATVDDLVAEAEALWGAHPEAAALVADALAVMAEAGMVRPPA